MTLRPDYNSDSFLKPSYTAHNASRTSRNSSSSSSNDEGKRCGGVQGIKNFASQIVRKRKRRNAQSSSDISIVVEDDPDSSAFLDDDSLSVCSLDVTPPETKRKKPSHSSLSRVTSFASVLSTPMAKMGNALHRSISSARLPSSSPRPSPTPKSAKINNELTPTKFFNRSFSVIQVSQSLYSNGTMKAPESPYGTLKRGGSGRGSSTQLTPYRVPKPTPNKQRPTRYWSLQFPNSCHALSKQEIKHQEAIYEISCGEEDLVEDMKLVEKTYAVSLLHLNILTASEVDLIFGRMKYLPPLHIDLYRAMRALRSPQTGVSQPIGQLLVEWVTRVGEPYINYCSNLLSIKAFLDARTENDKDFSDFLQRCLESPFSRKLDLWSYLDVPRSRLVKYPLLMKQILKFSESASDCASLAEAIQKMEKILKDVDRSMAQARCQLTIKRLDWLDENLEQQEAVRNASEEMLEGVLRNNRGTKLECHLMDTVLILGRPSTRGHGGAKRLQVYRTPIPVEDLVVEDLDGQFGHGSGSSTGSGASNTGSSGRHGSFKAAFTSSSQSVKNSFRVSFRDDPLNVTVSSNSSKSQTSHTLTARDEHSKRQWLTVLQKTIDTLACKNKAKSMLEEVKEETDARNKLGKAVETLAANSRTMLFQKNKRSPRIKASLSHAALENLKRGGGAKKIRTLASSSTKKTSVSTSALLRARTDNVENDTPLVHLGKMRSRTAHRRFDFEKDNSSSSSVLMENQARGRTKSVGHLHEKKNRTIDGANAEEKPRYQTRSRAKISKSMSDLLEM